MSEPAADGLSAPIRFADLDRPGRVLLTALAGVLGAAAGLLGTLQHLAVLEIGAVPIRFGIALAFAVGLLLLVGLRGTIDARLPVVVAAVCLGVVVVAAQLPSPAGTVLIGVEALSQVWGFGMPVLALLVAAWPRFAHTPRPDGGV
ncbi:hypothetical protein [Arenivirga flava]|uniref:Histidinol dehydrogenase n=1 Tax=Arenivirga flava TaxID=1930060 RepID=A0AA37UM80_9MICO|nr:hypothetical protein [Arenivirga flava]GMA29753.1 hypothetical protein GCM10025874_30060 [Arenivirga flava]